MKDDDFTTVVKFVVKHEKLINLLVSTFSDQATLVVPLLKSCCKEGCSNPATVEHKQLKYVMCDRCCAETICKSGRSFTADLEDPINVARGALMREDMWNDVQDADKIRRLVEYVETIKDTVDTKVVQSH